MQIGFQAADPGLQIGFQAADPGLQIDFYAVDPGVQFRQDSVHAGVQLRPQLRDTSVEVLSGHQLIDGLAHDFHDGFGVFGIDTRRL